VAIFDGFVLTVIAAGNLVQKIRQARP